MRIPAYWSKATAEETDREGATRSFTCWRASDSSSDDAHATALDAARTILRGILRGAEPSRYPYGVRALREDVKRRFTDAQGTLFAAITQNAYGSLVLNTARVMFVDVDFPPASPGASVGSFLKRLLGNAEPAPADRREQDAQDRLERFLADHADYGFRVYRTCAGLRVLATHALFDPAADATQTLLESLGSDPMYVRLCKAQESFRARLTPKPWRCGHAPNTIAWPRETEAQQRNFEAWQAEYLACQAAYATCRYLGALGSESIHPEAQTIVDIHDEATRCQDSLALA